MEKHMLLLEKPFPISQTEAQIRFRRHTHCSSVTANNPRR